MNSAAEKDQATKDRGLKPVQLGLVTSDKGDRTIRVQVNYSTKHRLYGKFLRRRMVFHAHDEKNEAKTGDTVEIMACKPISKLKRWRLLRIVRAGA